jgi:hypothetical protein
VSQAASTINTQLTTMSNAVSAAVKQLQSLKGSASAGWKKAFSNAQSCQALAGG